MRASDGGANSDDAVDPAQAAAIAAYLQAVAAAHGPDRAALMAADPDVAAFLARHDQLAELGSWWRMAAGEALHPTASIGATVNYSWELSAPPALPSLPGYEVLREIARGGMGIVYEARQTSLNRPVAVKIILHGGRSSPVSLFEQNRPLVIRELIFARQVGGSRQVAVCAAVVHHALHERRRGGHF